MKRKYPGLFIASILTVIIFAGCGEGSDNSAQPSEPQPYAMLIDLLPGAQASGKNWATAISGNGKFVVGVSDSANGKQAFRWSQSEGLTALGFLDGYTGMSCANAVDYYGDTIVGYCSADDTSARAFVWTPASGMQPIGNLPEGYKYQFATGVSADGSVIVGYVVGDDDEHVYAFLWTLENGISYFQSVSHAYAVSADGRVIVGDIIAPSYESNVFQAFRWSAGTDMVFLGARYEENPTSCAYAVSSDGNVIAGFTGDRVTMSDISMMWTWETGLVLMLPYFNALYAKSVSGDGMIIGGGGLDGGSAFLFHRVYGYQPLYNILGYYNLLDPLGNYPPICVYGISEDGDTIAGTAGSNILSPRAFIAHMPLQDFFSNLPF
jgi:probable HAF family extracellular repeat protein